MLDKELPFEKARRAIPITMLLAALSIGIGSQSRAFRADVPTAKEPILVKSKGKIKTVGITDLPAITPTQVGLDRSALQQIGDQHRKPMPANFLNPSKLANGRKETRAERYAREYPLPLIRALHSEPFHVDLETSSPPKGGFAVEGYSQRFQNDAGDSASEEIVWHWDVPEKMRSGYLESAENPVYRYQDAFRVYHLYSSQRNDPGFKKEDDFDILYGFDVKTGLRWRWDLLKFPDAKGRSLVNFANTLDGNYIIAVFCSFERTATDGTEIVVLNGKGEIVSRTFIAGVFAAAFDRNASGNSFKIVALVRGQYPRNLNELRSATILLQNDGQIKAILKDENNEILPGLYVDVSGDDSLATVSEKGFLYQLP